MAYRLNPNSLRSCFVSALHIVRKVAPLSYLSALIVDLNGIWDAAARCKAESADERTGAEVNRCCSTSNRFAIKTFIHFHSCGFFTLVTVIVTLRTHIGEFQVKT